MPTATWQQLKSILPPDAGPEREVAIVDMVRAGFYVEPVWLPVVVTDGSLKLTFHVMAEPLRLGDETDSVYPMVSAATAQAIADLLGARLPTSKMLDAVAEQADCFLDFGRLMADVADMTTDAMERQSRRIDQLAADCPAGKLRSTPGKQWVVSSRLSFPDQFKWGKRTACNYGGWTKLPAGQHSKRPWPALTAPSLRIWQPMGFTHNDSHTDYSQLAPQLVSKLVTVKSPSLGTVKRPIDEVAINPLTAHLVSAEGPVPMRMPWLAACQSLAEGGQCPPSPTAPPSPPPVVPPPVVPPPVSRAAAFWVTLMALGAATAYYLLRE